MKIRVIATGSTPVELDEKRWGLSLLIGETVLFDTFGMSSVFWENLCSMGVDASGIRHVIISHEHWDHITGLERLAGRNLTATVYICPHMDPSVKTWIKGLSMPVVEVGGWLEIENGVYSTGEVEGCYAGKPMPEQSLVIRDQNQLAVITGCAHPGLVPILDHVQSRFTDSLHLLMGGFHLMDSTNEDIMKDIAALRMHGVRGVAPTHCTGELAVRLLQDAFKDRYSAVEEGGVIDTAMDE